MNSDIYLDNNATTAVLPAAVKAAVQAMTASFGNPSSTHTAGLRAKSVIDKVRASAARLIGAGEGRIVFNSGATEGIQTAVLSALCAIRQRRAEGLPTGSLLVYGATEHKAVSESLAYWNQVLELNLSLRKLPVDAEGRHDLEVLRTLVPDAAFVCTMAANNETGAISDLDGIAAVLDGTAVLWMVDCVQALGKLPLNLASTRIDYAPFSGHKLYAPKGVGMLYVRAGAPLTPLMIGGGQEGGLRSGTENMAGIAAFGAVLGALEENSTFRSHAELYEYRDRIVLSLCDAFPGIVFNTPLENALPTTLNFSVPDLSSGFVLDLFDAAGIQVSAGSACSASKAQLSYVLEAMGLPEWRASNAVRLSFGPATDEAMVARACERIRRCGAVARLIRAPANASKDFVCSASDELADASVTGMHLDAADLAALLQKHSDLLLVDVRESHEHAASALGRGGYAAINVPLASLPDELAGLLELNGRAPVVFFCRSGNRSARAALCLRQHGHEAAYHLAGGIALSGGALPLKV